MILTETDIAEKATEDLSVINEYFNKILEFIVDKALLVFLAIVFLMITFRITKVFIKILKHSFDKSSLDKSVSGFLLSLIKIIINIILIIMAISMVGFQVTSLVTILGTASLAIGLALQGSLANFAGGVLILILKPFKIGDYIVENDKGLEGNVVSIDIFYTKLCTYDNKIIVIPNGNITNHSITNITAEEYRKLDIQIAVDYDSDIKQVKEILTEIVNTTPSRVASTDINVFVDSFADSAIIMGVRFMVKCENYWPTKWEVQERIKIEFDKLGIEIPYNKIDVNIKNKAL